MSYFTYIAFPSELNVFRLSDIKGKEKNYGITYDTTNFRKDILLFPDTTPDENHIVLVDKKEATFKNCFKNPFIYEYHVYLSRTYLNAVILDSDEKNSEWVLYKQVQYNFIMQHLNIGEFVEIYTEFTDHINFNLGPPESECTICLNEFINLLDTEIINKHKMTIYKINDE